jgi:hypothetical protein
MLLRIASGVTLADESFHFNDVVSLLFLVDFVKCQHLSLCFRQFLLKSGSFDRLLSEKTLAGVSVFHHLGVIRL